MRRFVVLAIVMILFGQSVLVLMPYANVTAEEFRHNVRVDSNVGSGTIRGAPSIDSDNGNIYIAWQDSRNGGSDIYYSRSNNQGASFLRDVRVNDNPIGDGTYQQNPSVAAENGTIYVVWEDGRAGIGSYEMESKRDTLAWLLTVSPGTYTSCGQARRRRSSSQDPSMEDRPLGPASS
jgi:hypothetical protein